MVAASEFARTTASIVAATVRGGAAAAVVPQWVDICSQLAPATSLILFAAPIPTILQISSSKSVGNLPLLPYSSMVANAALWTAYGLLKKESTIWTANGIGCILAIFYMYQFTRYAPFQSTTLPGSIKQHITFVISVILATIAMSTQPFIASPANIIGSTAVLFCMAMFASPLAALKNVLETKSAQSIPLPLALASLANCILWSIAGIFKMKDFNVIAPNIIGLASSITQLVLKIKYGNRPPIKTIDLAL